MPHFDSALCKLRHTESNTATELAVITWEECDELNTVCLDTQIVCGCPGYFFPLPLQMSSSDSTHIV